MKLLLDENLPKRLKLDFPEYEIFTVADQKWNGVKNGKLLKLMLENDFDVHFTFDKNLQFQQNFLKYPIAVLVLNAKDNSYSTLSSLAPVIKNILKLPLKAGPTEIKAN